MKNRQSSLDILIGLVAVVSYSIFKPRRYLSHYMVQAAVLLGLHSAFLI